MSLTTHTIAAGGFAFAVDEVRDPADHPLPGPRNTSGAPS